MMRINEVNPVPVITSKKKLEIKNVDVMIGEEMNWIFEVVITVTREGKIKNNAIIGTHEKRHSPYFYSKTSQEKREYNDWLKGKKKWLREND